jgi:hypothetical protein
MNVGGGAYILRGDYIYAYYNDKNPAVSNLRIACVARANLNEVAAAAAEHRVTVWNTYRDGLWDIPALSSTPGSDVLNRVYGNEDMHADAAYCSELGRYLMTSHDTPNHKLLLFSSEDGLDWTLETVVDETDEYVLQPYAAFVDYNSPTDDGRVVGGSFYIYYPRMSIVNQNNSAMYRRSVTVTKTEALFSQYFSSSTNAGDYIEGVAPATNQFTVINGGAVSIDAGRLKIVNAVGAVGNVRRWIDMEGTPVGGMSFSFEMEIAVAAGYAANTRLSTGTIGQPSANNFMAWGIDATGVENEWNVTGTPAVKFTGPQTVTIFLNDSLDPRHYTDPTAGTQVLAAYSYDVWVGTTLVSDGRTDNFVHPEYDLTAFNIGLTEAAEATWYFDDFEVVELPDDEGLTVYEDDFSGAAGEASVPEVSLAGYSAVSASIGLDGNGFLEGTPGAAGANYRFKIDTDPLTDDDSITEIKYTVEMRTPTNDWVMIGFHQNDAPNGFLVEGYNMGPVVQFSPTYVLLRGGTWGGGNDTGALSGYYSAGELITAEMTYHVAAQTMDLVINGTTVTNGWALNHEFPLGALSDPVVGWAQMQLRNQPTAANGGATIDSFKIETITALPSGYTGWAENWGVDIGAETDDCDGDGLINIYEYALGGDPTNQFDRGVSPVFSRGNSGFSYVYPQLASDQNSGLTCGLELCTNLVLGGWTNLGYTVAGTNVTGGDLDWVSNVVDAVEGAKFIRLVIEQE